jgi:ABC-type oligopeptide transport system ATPase subunit
MSDQRSANGVLLEVRDLKTHFPIRRGVLSRTVGHIRAVDGVSFDIRPGKTLGLVGESGCGKTTVGRTILRLIPPTSGEVRYKGMDLSLIHI